MADEKKNIFKKIGDALSSKDEKEALAKTEAELEALKRKTEVEEANRKRMEQAEKLKEAAEARKAEFEARKVQADALKVQVIAEHTVTNDDTLSGIALKYYKHATEPYWRFIYETNKEVIGDNPGVLRPGIVLKVVTLPEALKK